MKVQKVKVEVKEGMLIIGNESIRKEVEKIIKLTSSYTKRNKKTIETLLDSQVEISFSMNFNLKE